MSVSVGRQCSTLAALQHILQRFKTISLARGLIPAQSADSRKTHGDAGFMAGRALEALERYFQNQPLVRFMRDFAYRPEAIDRISPNEPIDLNQFLIGESKIGLADRHQHFAGLIFTPDPERVVRIVR